jgi:hypothetical protein
MLGVFAIVGLLVLLRIVNNLFDAFENWALSRAIRNKNKSRFIRDQREYRYKTAPRLSDVR